MALSVYRTGEKQRRYLNERQAYYAGGFVDATPNNGDVLQYDEPTRRWVPLAPPVAWKPTVAVAMDFSTAVFSNGVGVVNGSLSIPANWGTWDYVITLAGETTFALATYHVSVGTYVASDFYVTDKALSVSKSTGSSAHNEGLSGMAFGTGTTDSTFTLWSTRAGTVKAVVTATLATFL